MTSSPLERSVQENLRLKRRYRAEKRFRFYGRIAIFISLFCLATLVGTVLHDGYKAFYQTCIRLPIYFDENIFDPQHKGLPLDQSRLSTVNYTAILNKAVAEKLGIDPKDRRSLHEAVKMISAGARVTLRDIVLHDPGCIGHTQEVTLLASSNIDSAYKGDIDLKAGHSQKISSKQVGWMHQLIQAHALFGAFNKGLFLHAASSRPESSGLAAGLIGSFYMLLIVLCVGLPLGAGAAIYLEEYAKKNRWNDFLEININNLAAVPSIVFGLLGLEIFINLFHLPRSASLVGGLVLTLMSLPTIIIATRAALRAVPPSVRLGALGLGASKTQTIFHHVLPLALPGILTGTIISLAQALGQTAPLLLIGMVAFVADCPRTPLDPATALPVQIYIWTNEMDRAFVARASGAIIVLLLFLVLMNIAAVWLRRRFERRW